MPGDIDKEIDRLYGLPLEDFTQARNELARALAKEKRRAESGRVKDLRKPTLPVWVINQLARREKMLVRSLLGSADRVRRAQERMLSGGSSDRLREATLKEREAITSLLAAADRTLVGEGERLPQSVRDRIDRTLRAAAVDAEGRELLVHGRLSGELDPTGFGPAPKLSGAEKRKASEKATVRRKEQRERASALQGKLEARVREARKAVKEAERQSGSARRAAEAKDRLLEQARRDLEDALAAKKSAASQRSSA